MPGTFGSGIKVVQRGVVNFSTDSTTATITAVVLAKSFALISQVYATDYANAVVVVLTNTTTLSFGQTGTKSVSCAWQVVEYY